MINTIDGILEAAKGGKTGVIAVAAAHDEPVIEAVVEARIADLEATLKVARVIDDSEMLACMHYILVRPTHHGQGIAGKMVEYIKEKYKHYLYIELMPEERKNAVFYEKHGFRIMPDGAPMFLANYENKI